MPPDSPARLVPVWRDLLCDGVTPVEVYARLRTSMRGSPLAGITFMLESVGAGERWARYSVVGVGCRARVTGIWDGADVALTIAAAPGFTLPADIPAENCGLHLHSRGLDALRALLAAYRCPPVPDLPRFWGGLCGVWGHDMVRVFEPVPPPPGVVPHSAELPALDLIVTDTLVVFDNFSQRVRIVACACPETDGGPIAAIDAAYARIDAVASAIDTHAVLRPRHLPQLPPPQPKAPAEWSRDGYLAAVAKAKQYIAAGDIFQVVLSQAFRVPRANGGALDAIELYRMLRATNPAPYMYIFELPSAGLIGASPEVLVRLDHLGARPAGPEGRMEGPTSGLRVTLRPIAGTRPRGPSEAEDAALAAELLADPKERAEHLMLVDLGRNDLGRVCTAGSVRVTDSFVIERYSRVMHIVSEIQGDLRPGLDALDALRATFPAGTLSGAPKIRALQIIDELEPIARGWYGGAVGYLGFDGAADFAICIRSLVRHRDHIRVQAGAGIVHDSIPAAEERECQAKASAVIHAIELAAEASDPVPPTPEPVQECPR